MHTHLKVHLSFPTIVCMQLRINIQMKNRDTLTLGLLQCVRERCLLVSMMKKKRVGKTSKLVNHAARGKTPRLVRSIKPQSTFHLLFFMRAERNDKKAVASTCEHQSPPRDIQQGEDARRPSTRRRRLFPGALFAARYPRCSHVHQAFHTFDQYNFCQK
jgi:hypothetical protein